MSTNKLTKHTLGALAGVIITAVLAAMELVPGLARMGRLQVVQATVVRGEVKEEQDSKGRPRYAARHLVRYAFEGRDYEVWRPAAFVRSIKREEAQREVDALAPGSTAPVWVDPRSPADGHTEPFPRWILPVLVLCLAALRLYVDSLAEALDDRRKERREQPFVAALSRPPVEVEGVLRPRGGPGSPPRPGPPRATPS